MQRWGRNAMAHAKHDPQSTLSSDEALVRLQQGNARFLAGQARFPTVQKEVLAELARGQRPFATILGCSDSRVPPELLFDASFGRAQMSSSVRRARHASIFGR